MNLSQCNHPVYVSDSQVSFRGFLTTVAAVSFLLTLVDVSGAAEIFVVSNSLEEVDDESWTEIKCRTTLQYEVGSDGKPNFFAPIELEQLEVGKRYKLLITAVNPTNSAISYSSIRVDCACAKFETDIREIPANGEGQFSMYLTPSNIISSRPITTSARFVDNETGQLAIRLQVLYQLSGVFGFNSDRFTLELPFDENLIVSKIPIVFQPPVTLDQLEVKTSENLRDSAIVLRPDPENDRLAYVEVTVSKDLVVSGDVMGELVLQKREGEGRAVVILAVQHEQRLSISPESVRLTQDNSAGPFTAIAVLRVSKSLAAVGNQEAEELGSNSRIPRVELSIHGNPARLEIKPLGKSGIYRLMVAYDGPLEVNSDGIVDASWCISFNGESRVIKTYAFSPTQPRVSEGDR